jgi:anaerobic nitric oxide reductase transcription regulator
MGSSLYVGEELAERRGEVAQTLVVDALKRQGGELLGQSPAMAQVRRELQVVSESDLTVLISGETGTGKELVARTVHARSRRADQPLVYINCAALPESIAESELFGHRKGAFTGAVADRAGKFEIADNGTMFLDENQGLRMFKFYDSEGNTLTAAQIGN